MGALCRSDGLRRVWACLLLKRLWLLRETGLVERGAALKAGALRFCRRALRGAAVEAAAFRDSGWDMAASGDGLRPVAAKKKPLTTVTGQGLERLLGVRDVPLGGRGIGPIAYAPWRSLFLNHSKVRLCPQQQFVVRCPIVPRCSDPKW